MKLSVTNLKHTIADTHDAVLAQRAYNATMKQLHRQIRRRPEVQLAIIIHLYYPDMWDVINDKLTLLQSVACDVFVSVPAGQLDDARAKVLRSFPDAYVIPVPNKGRDILPFMHIAREVYLAGYGYTLKVHTKKSPQHLNGAEWSTELIDKLIPSSKAGLDTIFKLLKAPATGMIGPLGNYLPLPTYYVDNHHTIMYILASRYGTAVSKQIEGNKERYGFFAGSMFWARLDGLAPLLVPPLPMRKYAVESGQLDGTLAHAIERCISLSYEIARKNMYAISGGLPEKIAYTTDKTQTWWDDEMKRPRL